MGAVLSIVACLLNIFVHLLCRSGEPYFNFSKNAATVICVSISLNFAISLKYISEIILRHEDQYADFCYKLNVALGKHSSQVRTRDWFLLNKMIDDWHFREGVNLKNMYKRCFSCSLFFAIVGVIFLWTGLVNQKWIAPCSIVFTIPSIIAFSVPWLTQIKMRVIFHSCFMKCRLLKELYQLYDTDQSDDMKKVKKAKRE